MSIPPVKVCRLGPEDAAAYQTLRLRALRECPEAFSASFDDEAGRSDDEVAARIAPSPDGSLCMLGIFEHEALHGFLAVLHPQRRKLRHAIELAGLYIDPPSRRRGLGGSLLRAAIDHARSLEGVCRIKLEVNEANAAARALYRSAGFEYVGIEPDALNIEGTLYNVERYVLRLRDTVGVGIALGSTCVTQYIGARRADVYRALVDARAVAAWMVPDGMTSCVHDFDPREGGAFRISLTYDSATGTGKTTARTDSFHGRFVRLVPNEQLVETVEFETGDPTLQGEMTISISLTDEAGGTRVLARHDRLPPGLPPDDNETGWRSSLAKLAAFVEDRGGSPSTPDPWGPRIREYDDRDLAAIRSCLAVLQEGEREYDARLPPGDSIAGPYLEMMLERCRTWHGTVFVAEVGGGIVGFACIWTRVPCEMPDDGITDYGLVSDLVVLPAHRRSGLGRALLRRAEGYARRARVHRLRIGVLASNTPARNLYCGAGFAPHLEYLEKELVPTVNDIPGGASQ